MMPKAAHFDYVIVGVGSAGCVLANRLSEDPDVRVLLLEAGGPDSHPMIHLPMGVGRLHTMHHLDWGYVSEKEAALGERMVDAKRGKLLGGSSSLNMTAYTRGDAGDYDRWAANGARGWSYAEVLPYFERLEAWRDPPYDGHGRNGPVGVQLGRTNDPLVEAWLEAGREAGLPENPDVSSGSIFGLGRGRCTVKNGRRSSAASAYIRPALRRRNLTLKMRARASRLIFDGSMVAGVDYVDGRGVASTAYADREVILSTGAFNTPQLLMLSGIGPANHLQEFGIRVVQDLPVGRNLQDHQIAGSAFERKGPGELHREMRFDRMTRHMMQAWFLRSGYAASLPMGLLGFVRSDPSIEVPDIELLMSVGSVNAQLWFPGVRKPYQDTISVRSAILRPASRGSVTLRSTDPADKVRIHFNFFSDTNDLRRLRKGVRLGRELAYSKALDTFRGRELAPGPGVQSDDELDGYIRRSMVTVHHPGCTCPMGQGDNSVLTPDLKVRGVDRLRVVDASAMPDLVSGHINACVLMMAERAADLIRGRPTLSSGPQPGSSASYQAPAAAVV